ncbi:ABC transporter ATP-binding protein [Rhizobium johnstonii]|uniref:ABC transporter ATP-binding protein n=1 Tax=Rhizobium TaxID=379 RepID=UPI00140FE6F6|nr:ABC transporter ATP-binding protein [Rhizobium leguminosarum]QIO64047.1 ABC transporter ATP-binding protein [Rhizobium leguminosarum bv. trifolii]
MALIERLEKTGVTEDIVRQQPVAVALNGITKSYGIFNALKPLNVHLAEGELLSLLGPSGCGKTTTLRIVAGFVAPDAGSIQIGGRDVTNIAPNDRGLGMVFQSYSLFPHMTVAENVAFGLKMQGVPRAERVRRVGEALETVHLDRLAERYPREMSGGQQQRVALARALITRPSVLLLDEPLGALDKNLRERMQMEIRDLQRRLHITTILVTHDQEEAMTMSDRIAVMSDGALVQIGTPEEIYDFPETQFVSEFLGTSNLFSATALEEGYDGSVVVRLEDSGSIVEARAHPGSKTAPGDRVTVAVRPERLHLVDGDGGLPATLRNIVFRGTHRLYEMSIHGRAAPVIMSSPSPLPISSDDPVRISWGRNAVVLKAGENK